MLTLESFAERQFAHDGRDIPARPVAAVEGRLPDVPAGTWYLNGPGRSRAPGIEYRHWLDGDGLIRALVFGDGRVTFASRFVRTRKYHDESRAGRPLFRTFGTAFRGDRLNERQTGLESPANISVLPFAGGLLALGEQGQPWQIDPSSLKTVGAFTAAGTITPVTPFAAHAKVDAATGEMVNFGVSFSVDKPVLNVFRLDPAGRQMHRARIPLHCSCTIHDFALTPTAAVFYVSPYVLDVAKLHAGRSVMEALDWRPELGSHALVVSRDTGELRASIPIGARYCLHTINAFDERGTIVLDVIEMPRPIYEAYTLPRLFEAPVESAPIRLRLDLTARTLMSREVLPTACAPEFPVIDPAEATRRTDTFWALGISAASTHGAKFFDQVMRLDWNDPRRTDTYQASGGILLGGEPALVRDQGGAMWLLCQILDVPLGRGGFAVFDAKDLAAGPVARLWLDEPTPMAFHGTYVHRRS